MTQRSAPDPHAYLGREGWHPSTECVGRGSVLTCKWCVPPTRTCIVKATDGSSRAGRLHSPTGHASGRLLYAQFSAHRKIASRDARLSLSLLPSVLPSFSLPPWMQRRDIKCSNDFACSLRLSHTGHSQASECAYTHPTHSSSLTARGRTERALAWSGEPTWFCLRLCGAQSRFGRPEESHATSVCGPAFADKQLWA